MTRRLPIFALLLVLSIALAAFAATHTPQYGTLQPRPAAERATNVMSPRHGGHGNLDENIYYEDWESGTLDGWTAIDNTAVPSTWHIDTWNAFGGSGHSWWVGDTTNHLNGYRDAQYFVLDTPPINLPATTPGMVFQSRYSCEPPNGPFDPPTYNGWDGMNLRISTDGGTTWSVVPTTALTPAYDRTSLYSFGFQHHEGENVPGWCGASTTWHQQLVNLTAWAGQTVKLRFAFASDPSYSTPNNPSMFGWQVDNVRVYQTGATDTVFTDNCDDNSQNWTTRSMLVVGGNLWRIATDNTSPAGAHILVCNDQATGRYHANMNTVIESPYIDARDHTAGTLTADVQLTGSVACDQASFPDCDYWGMDISIDSGATWCAVSNPTCDPNGQNFVYIDFPTFWASFDSSYSNPMDFSSLLGHVLKFRFTFQSNTDTALDVGAKFDGFTVDYAAGFPNDVSCYTLQVRYPNIVSHPFRIKAYFSNPGQNQQNTIPAYWKVMAAGQTNHPFGQFALNPNETTTKIANVTINTANTYSMKAWTQLSADDNTANDSATVDNIVMQPATSDPEIGYDNRSVQYRFNYQTGQGPLIKFTPNADSVILGEYNIKSLMAQFDAGQTGDLPIRFHVYADNAGVPGTSLYNQEITVAQDETGTQTWKTVDTNDETALQHLTGPFWVWLETVSTDPDARYPEILGDDILPWSDIHNYTWIGSGNPSQATYFYQIHAVVASSNATPDHTVTMPATWNLEQNYPNPFNPSTEIRYSVPRAEHITLKVFNLMGQEVATLVNEDATPGAYRVSFDGSNLPSGVYVYRIQSASFSAAHKMLLMK